MSVDGMIYPSKCPKRVFYTFTTLDIGLVFLKTFTSQSICMNFIMSMLWLFHIVCAWMSCFWCYSCFVLQFKVSCFQACDSIDSLEWKWLVWYLRELCRKKRSQENSKLRYIVEKFKLTTFFIVSTTSLISYDVSRGFVSVM